jgi:hypothetical protein
MELIGIQSIVAGISASWSRRSTRGSSRVEPSCRGAFTASSNRTHPHHAYLPHLYFFYIPVVLARLLNPAIPIFSTGHLREIFTPSFLSDFDHGPGLGACARLRSSSALGEPRRPELPELVDAST